MVSGCAPEIRVVHSPCARRPCTSPANCPVAQEVVDCRVRSTLCGDPAMVESQRSCIIYWLGSRAGREMPRPLLNRLDWDDVAMVEYNLERGRGGHTPRRGAVDPHGGLEEQGGVEPPARGHHALATLLDFLVLWNSVCDGRGGEPLVCAATSSTISTDSTPAGPVASVRPTESDSPIA